MAPITVHLDAYIVPPDHSAWKCFPGRTYRFYEIVRDNNVAFLDVRGLEALGGNPSEWKDKEALEIIAADRWSRETRRGELGYKMRGTPDVSRVDRRTLTFLKGLLLKAKKGDLVVVPAEGYQKEVLIGELTSDAGASETLNVLEDGKNVTYVGRSIRWMGSQEKRLLSKELIDLLHTQTAFFSLPKSLYEEIYRIAYKNFVYNEVYTATFFTSKQQFTTSDSAVVGMWFNALAAVRDAVDNGKSIDGLSYLELGLTESGDPAEGELSININSPGEYLIRSIGVFALVVMAMLPLSEVPAEDIIQGQISVTMNPIGGTPTDCPLKIQEAITNYAHTLSVIRLQQACIVGERARKEATLRTDGKLIAKPKTPK